MATLADIQNKLESVDIWDIVMDILIENKQLLIDFNKSQLLQGKTSENEKITPDYRDDDWFNSVKWTPKSYAIFKKKISNNNTKGFYTPDFFITGALVHDMIDAYKDGNRVLIEARGEASSFDDKWKNIYGVTDEYLQSLKDTILPELNKRFRKHLNI